MATAAYLPIVADRAGACVRLITFKGVDLTGVALRLQVRYRGDTPGTPNIDLAIAAANAQGLSIKSVSTTGAYPVSVVQIRINEATMKDAAAVPYMGELGDPSVLAYDMIGTFGNDKRRLIYGDFVALPTVNGADGAPTSRGLNGGDGRAWSTWAQAVVSLTDDGQTVSIDGLDFLAPLVDEAKGYSEAAAASAASLDAALVAAGQQVATLQGNLNSEADARSAADGQLVSSITSERFARILDTEANAAFPEPGAADSQTWASVRIGGDLADDALYPAGAFTGWVVGFQPTGPQIADRLDLLLTSTATISSVHLRIFERSRTSSYDGPPDATQGDRVIYEIDQSLSGLDAADGNTLVPVSIPMGGIAIVGNRWIMAEITAGGSVFGIARSENGAAIAAPLRGYYRIDGPWAKVNSPYVLSALLWGRGAGDALAGPRRTTALLSAAAAAIGDTLVPVADGDAAVGATVIAGSEQTGMAVWVGKRLAEAAFLDAIDVSLGNPNNATQIRATVEVIDAIAPTGLSAASARRFMRRAIGSITTPISTVMSGTAQQVVTVPLPGLSLPAGARLAIKIEMLNASGANVAFKYGIASLQAGEDAWFGGLRREVGATAYQVQINGGYRVWGKIRTRRSRLPSALLARLAPVSHEVAQFGDSLTDDGGSGTTINEAIGYQAWAEMLGDGRFTLPPDLNFGVGGNTTTQMLARVGTVAASRADIVVFHGGTNDGDALATTKANYVAIHDALVRAAGKRLLVTNLLPRSDTTSGQNSRLEMRAWITEVVARWPGVVVADPAALISDPAATDWLPRANVLRDGLHYAPRGACMAGRTIAARLREMLPARQPLTVSAGDVWNAARPAGNLVANAMMTGTAAASGFSAGTGNVPTGYLPVLDNAAGLTVVWSIGTDADGYAYTQAVITGTPTASQPGIRLVKTVDVAQLTAGDTLYGAGKVTMLAGGAGVYVMWAEAYAGAVSAACASPGGGSSPVHLSDEAIVGIAPLAPFVVPASAANAAIVFGVRGSVGVPMQATVRFSRPTLRKKVA